MPLPISTAPVYRITLPVSQQEVDFRPFLVKEEKILLMASESKDTKQILSAIKQIVKECTFDKVDISSLSNADLEFLFVNLRAKSAGETANPIIKCEKCTKSVKLEVDMTKATVDMNGYEGNTVMLTDRIGVILKFPTYDILSELDINFDSETVPDTESNFKIIIRCIDKIFDETNVYDTKDYSEKELMEFVESLTQASFKKFIKYFENLPKLSQKVSYTCASCNHEGTIQLQSMQDFFS